MDIVVVELPSKKKLEIQPAPFGEANQLQKAVAAELKKVGISTVEGFDVNFIKNAFFTMIESPVIEAALWPCIKRCTYEGLKITMDTFEPISAREDYNDICFAVMKENLAPFTKSLSAQFKGFATAAVNIQL